MTGNGDRAGLDRHGEAYTRALVEGDLEGWLATMTDDCVFLPPGMPAVRGKEMLRRWVKEAFFDVFDIVFEFGYEAYDVHGSTASAWGWYRQGLTPKAGGDPLQLRGKFIDVFKRCPGGDWLLDWCCFNTNQ
jgi:ketosteroid isomerase-like protein